MSQDLDAAAVAFLNANGTNAPAPAAGPDLDAAAAKFLQTEGTPIPGAPAPPIPQGLGGPAPTPPPAPPQGPETISARPPKGMLETFHDLLFGGGSGPTFLGSSFPSQDTVNQGMSRANAPLISLEGALPNAAETPGGNVALTVAHHVAGAVDSLTKPENLAIGSTAVIPGVGPLLAMGFGAKAVNDAAQKYPELRRAIAAKDYSTAAGILTDAGIGIATAALGAHGVGKAGAAGVDAVLDTHNARAADLVEQDRKTGMGTETGKDVLGSESMPVDINGKPHTVEPTASTHADGRPAYAVKDANGKTVFAGNGSDLQGYLRTNSATPPGVPPRPTPKETDADEGPDHSKTPFLQDSEIYDLAKKLGADDTQLGILSTRLGNMDQATRLELTQYLLDEQPAHPEAGPTGPKPNNPPNPRKTAAPPTIPETGVPDQVQRTVDARERLAQQYGGRSWKDLSNPQRLVIDGWITEGYGQAVTPPPAKPAAAAPAPEPAAEPAAPLRPEQTRTPAPGAPRPKSESPLVPPTPAAPERTPTDDEVDRALSTEPPPVAKREYPDVQIPPEYLGKTVQVKTAAGYKALVQYAMVPTEWVNGSHDHLGNPNPRFLENDPDNQPRDRSTAASLQQMADQRENFDPDLMQESPLAGNGASIVTPNLFRLTRNGGGAVLQGLYNDNHPNAQFYKQQIEANAKKFGIEGEFAPGDKPELVRILRSLPAGISNSQFALDTNESTTASMSTTEQAKVDSRQLDADLLGKFVPNDEGRIATPDNRDFIRSFADRIVGKAKLNEFMTEDGTLSQSGEQRIRNAIFHAAYQDTGTLSKLSEDLDPNIKNTMNGMLRAAPHFAVQRQQIAAGNLYPRDLSGDVAAAAKKLSALRDAKTSIAEYQAQQGLFGNDLSPIQHDVLKLMGDTARSPNKLGEVLQQYTHAVELAGDPKQTSMFGATEPASKADLLNGAIQRVKELRSKEKTDGVSEQPAIQQSQPGVEPDRARRAAQRGTAAAPGAGKAKAPAKRERAESHSEQSDTPGPRNDVEPPEHGPFGPIFRQYRNQPLAAAARLREEQTGEAAAALSHEHFSAPIDLVFGKAGDPNNDYRGGFGIAHIDAKHGERQTNELLARFPRLTYIRTNRGRAYFEDAEYFGIIRLDYEEKEKHWLLSGWEKDAPSSEGSPVVFGTHAAKRSSPDGANSSVADESPAPQASDVAFPTDSQHTGEHDGEISQQDGSGPESARDKAADDERRDEDQSERSVETGSAEAQAGGEESGRGSRRREAGGGQVNPLHGEADPEGDRARLRAAEDKARIAFQPSKTLDAGKESIEDSPLFGGPRQGSMFESRAIGGTEAAENRVGSPGRPATRGVRTRTPAAPRSALDKATLGGAQFLNDDVKPTLQAAASAVTEAADDILKVLAPTLRSKSGKMAGLVLRHNLGEMSRQYDIAKRALETAWKYFESQPTAENYAFIHRVEMGEAQPTAELQQVAGVLRKLLDERRIDVQELGTGKLQKFYEDYFPHIWKRFADAQKTFQTFMGRRPFEGGKNFLKQRTHITFQDGLDAGLEPISSNPVDLILLKAREMDRYLAAHRTLNEWKENGTARFVDARGAKAPKGWMKIEDPIGTVYGPSAVSVSEYPNEGLYRGLSDFAKQLGLSHTRSVNIGGRKKRLGVAFKNTNRLATKFATDEQVLAHEIGHHIEFQHKFVRGMMKHPDDKTRKALKSELRDLADARFEGFEADDAFRNYVRNADEKAANVVAAYVTARDKMRKIAPTVLREFESFLDRTPSLQAIRRIEPNLVAMERTDAVDAGGLVIKGHYYAPEPAARVLNNYLAPGLRAKSGAYRAFLGANNVLQQFQLGYSGFHIGFTSFDAAISKGALGIEQALRGQPIRGLGTFAQFPIAPFTNYLRGSKLLKEWSQPGEAGGPIAMLADAMTKGGGRAGLEQQFQTHIVQQMRRAFKDGNIWGGLMRSPFALTEAISGIIMRDIVPKQKLGAFADLAAYELERLGPDATLMQVRDKMANVWDSIDNRMGQLVYDNLFWDRTVKDIAQLMVRSVGWNLGTIREVGGGVLDAVRVPAQLAGGKPPEELNLHRLAYVLSMVVINAIWAALYQYLHGAGPPKSWKDLVFPRNGKKDENGRDERFLSPSYIKDVYHYVTDPLKTLEGKIAPVWTNLSEMVHNKDFYGTKIRNEDDPIVKQMLDVAKHAFTAFEPFGVRNFLRSRNLGESLEQQIEPMIGITKAPADLERTPAEKLAAALAATERPEAGRTAAEAARRDAEHDIGQRIRSGRPAADQIREALKNGTVTARGLRETLANAKQPELVRAFTHLPIGDALKVWDRADKNERTELRPLLFRKMANADKNLPPAQLAGIQQRFRDAVRQ